MVKIAAKETSAPKAPPQAGLNNNNLFSNWAMIGMFWIMAFGALTIAKAFFIPVCTAIVLALIFSPIRRQMKRMGIRPAISAGIILATIVLILAISAFFLAAPMQTRVEKLPNLIPMALERIEEIFGVMETVIEAGEQIDEMSASTGAEKVVVEQPGLLSVVATTTPRVLAQIVFTLAMMMFLISSGDLFYEKLVQVMPRIKEKRRAVKLVKSIEERVSSYFFTITLINAALGVAVGTAFWLLGMPDPIFFGILAFLLNYIPFVGAIIGVSVTFMVALVSLDSALAAVFPPLVYFVLNATEGQFITPVMVGRTLRLNAVVVFLAVALGAWMWGFMGMFLAIPALIIFKAVTEDIKALHPIGEFLGERTRHTAKEHKILKTELATKSEKAPLPDQPSAK